jgi:hypothetical protein
MPGVAYLTLTGGDVVDGKHWFEPGGMLTGTVEMGARDAARSSHAWVAVERRYMQYGLLKLETETIQQRRFDLKEAGDAPVAFTFELPLPIEPWSYAGKNLSITWEVSVVLVDLEPTTDDERPAALPFFVRPRGAR